MQRFIINLPKSNTSNKKRTFSNVNDKIMLSKSSNIIKSNKTQMYIDLGQKSFNTMKKCKLCDMMYVLNDKEDETNHNKFCKENIRIPSLLSLNGFKIVDKFNDDKYILIKVDYQQYQSNKAIQEVIHLMKTELGSSDDIMKPTDSIYLCLQNSLIIGCIVCEKITSSQRILITHEEQISKGIENVIITNKTSDIIDILKNYPNNENINNINVNKDLYRNDISSSSSYNKNNISSKNINNNSTTTTSYNNRDEEEIFMKKENMSTSELILGIKLIWIHNNYRRLHIGYQCLDIIRKRFQYGYILKIEDLTFSQPTSDGYQFACYYSKSKSIWIY